MKPIFLIGYMGSGKTTLGRALSQATGMQFIDLDEYIENRYRMSISDIFSLHGEAAFRQREQAMLTEVADFEDVIIACGGGTPCFYDNMELMNRRGTTVLLEASHARLSERLSAARSKRPLIAAMTDEELDAYIRSALSARMPHYGKAHHRFCSDRLDDRAQIAESVKQFIATFNLTDANEHQH